jgi:hypothetical protein
MCIFYARTRALAHTHTHTRVYIDAWCSQHASCAALSKEQIRGDKFYARLSRSSTYKHVCVSVYAYSYMYMYTCVCIYIHI